MGILVHACLGYLFGTLVMSAAAIAKGLTLLGQARILSQLLVDGLQILHAAVALGAVLVLPMIIGRVFDGRLTHLGGIVMLAVFAVTVFLMTRVLMLLGLFRPTPSGR